MGIQEETRKEEARKISGRITKLLQEISYLNAPSLIPGLPDVSVIYSSFEQNFPIGHAAVEVQTMNLHEESS